MIENIDTTLTPDKEVVIIGGGITGITCAYLLSRKNIKTILFEKGKNGEAVTMATTGMLTPVIDIEPLKLIKLFGVEDARKVIRSHVEAIDDIEKIILEENIDCNFTRCNNYIYASSNKEENLLKQHLKAYISLGLDAEYKEDGILKFSKYGYLEIKNVAKFYAAKYVKQLTFLASKNGAEIIEGEEVLSVTDKVASSTIVLASGKKIEIKNIFMATYLPMDAKEIFSGHYNMYRTYVIMYEISQKIFPAAIYQDTKYPYNYLKVNRGIDHDVLFVGGNDHLDVIGLDESAGYKVMQEYADKQFVDFEKKEIRHWSGEILNTVDSLPFIGKIKNKNVFYAFGFSGNGMTYSYIAAKIFVDSLDKKESEYIKIYNADRKLKWWANIFGS